MVSWHVETQGLVRTFKIVEVAPLVEAFLRNSEVVEAFIAQDLGLERAMETLVFALGLRMMRATVAQTHAESQKPYFESREVAFGPGRGVGSPPSVVTEDDLGQAVATHNRPGLDGLFLLIRTRFQAQGKATVVVEHRQGIAPSAAGERKVALEIHLPQFVGRVSFEALVGDVFGGFFRADQVMASQDRSACGDRRYFVGGQSMLAFVDALKDPLADLAWSPGRVVVADGQEVK